MIMIVNNVGLIHFSPTGTSRKVSESIGAGFDGMSVEIFDLTVDQSVDELVFTPDTLVVFTIPVYGGHVVPLALERLRRFRGQNTPAVVVVVYGNRAYEQALIELNQFVEQQGFKVIAGATFIGEHSYSTTTYPIASGRPDAADLDYATSFGRKIVTKLTQAETLDTLYGVDVRQIRRPKQPFFPLFRFLRQVVKMRKSGLPLPRTPQLIDEQKCQQCGACVSHCPTGAITLDDKLHIDADKCIKCCACVKVCPSKALVFDTPYSKMLNDCFKKPKDPQLIL